MLHRHLPSLFAAFVAASAVFGVVFALDTLEHQRAIQKNRLHVMEQVSALRIRVESGINQSVALTRSMAALYAIHPELTHDKFVEMAKEIVDPNPAIRNIGLIRGTVVRYVYPLAGNEKAVGLDFRKEPGQWPAFSRMMSERSIVAAGPEQLVQGGAAIIVRVPVLHRGQYIGAISSPMLIDRLLQDAGVTAMAETLQIALRNADGQMIYGRPEVFSADTAAQPIELPGSNWEIAALPHAGWENGSATRDTIRILGAALCLLAATLAFMLVRHLQRRAEAEQRLNASEAALKQRTAELTHQNAVLDMITHNAELPSILEMLAMLVEVHHPDMLCSILLLDPDGRRLRHGASPSLPEFYNRAIDGLPIGHDGGCCGAAAFSGERVIVEDVLGHPYCEVSQAMMQQAELRSCWSQPIKDSDERVLGTFAIYHRHPAAPQPAEIMLIEHYASLAALAIERTHNAEMLRLQNAALNFAANAIIITDRQGRIVWANHAFSDLTGYEFDELIGRKHAELVKSGQQDGAFYARMWETILSGQTWQGELVNRRKDGSLYYEEMTITPVYDLHQNITHFVAIRQDISARKQNEEHLKNLAFYDALTRLPNRRLLLDRLGQTLASCRRTNRHGALMFLDLDNFKPLNDEHGHDVGDLLLAEASQRIAGCVREEDTVSRFGGDEFVVLLKDLDADRATATAQATVVAEKIRTALSETYRLPLLQAVGGRNEIEHRCTTSIGIALFTGTQDGQEEILKQADVAMYQAKSAGRNTIRLHLPDED